MKSSLWFPLAAAGIVLVFDSCVYYTDDAYLRPAYGHHYYDDGFYRVPPPRRPRPMLDREGRDFPDDETRRRPPSDEPDRGVPEPPPTDIPPRNQGSDTPAKPRTETSEVLTGTKTNRPGRVKSPYAPFRELDVSELQSGSLAKDPVSGKIFRVP